MGKRWSKKRWKIRDEKISTPMEWVKSMKSGVKFFFMDEFDDARLGELYYHILKRTSKISTSLDFDPPPEHKCAKCERVAYIRYPTRAGILCNDCYSEMGSIQDFWKSDDE